MSLPLASQLHRPESSYGSWPQVSLSNCLLLPPSTPLPSPMLALNLPFTLPNTPTFIPAHKQAPTCLPLHSSPFTHRHICFCSHFPRLKHARIPMHAHALAHTQTCALPTQLLLGSQNWFTYTQTTPAHASVPQLVHPLPVRSTQHPALPTELLLADTPPWATATLPSPSQDCLPACCFPSSSLSSPASPSSQNSPCHCGHCHLRCCHC